MFPTQSAVNGLLRTEVGNPFLSGAISNLVGALIMLILALNTAKSYPFMMPVFTKSNWFMVAGGVFSALIVVSNLIGPQKIGFVTYMSFFLVFQLIGSALIDYLGFFQAERRPLSFQMLMGLVFLIVGIIMIVKDNN